MSGKLDEAYLLIDLTDMMLGSVLERHGVDDDDDDDEIFQE